MGEDCCFTLFPMKSSNITVIFPKRFFYEILNFSFCFDNKSSKINKPSELTTRVTVGKTTIVRGRE